MNSGKPAGRFAFVLALFAFAFALAAAAARPRAPGVDAPLVAKGDFTKLEAIAKELAAKGRAPETNELLDVMRELRDDSAELTRVRTACEKALAKAKTPAQNSALASVVRSLHAVAGEMGKEIAALDREPGRDLAAQILRLDDDAPAAQERLGRQLEKGKWIDPERTKILARRAEIEAAVVQARKFEVALKREPSNHPVLVGLGVAPGTVIRFEGIAIHSDMEGDRIERIVRRAFQAMALSKFLRGFPLDLPGIYKKAHHQYVLLSSRELYLKEIERALQEKRLTSDHAARARELGGFYDDRDNYVECDVSELSACASTAFNLADLYYEPGGVEQPCLVMGHVNWLCLTLFGVPPPGLVKTPKNGRAEEPHTTDAPRNAAEEKRAEELKDAGIAGARRFFVFKAARGEDPVWSRSFVEDPADLVDLDLLKSTFVVEYLQESSRFDSLLRETQMKKGDKRSRADVIEAALPEKLRGFEKNFHTWLFPGAGGLAQRLALPPAEPEKPSKEELAALAALDHVRKSCWDPALYGPFNAMEADRELSAGCAAHARYLKIHSEQLAKWPDAHEEYPEKEGFTRDGCWSGMHSVIAPGVATADEAVAGWIGTFYHRLPLLEPGLKRIGFSLVDHVAVLDADSMVEQDQYDGLVLYPPRDGKDVPTRFTPGGELPHPVPGEDERNFGFPITLQTTHRTVEYRMRLVHGPSADGPEVPCHLSTPSHPTYVELAPPNTSCLLPKARLAARTKFTVVAEPSDGGATITWSFTTGE